MSMSLYLTKFAKMDEQKYSEEKSKNLIIVEISDDLYKEIIEEFVCEQDFWETGGEQSYPQRIIPITDINKILERCICRSKEIMKEVVEMENSKKEEDMKLDMINTILQIRHLLNKKREKYNDQDNIFIIAG